MRTITFEEAILILVDATTMVVEGQMYVNMEVNERQIEIETTRSYWTFTKSDNEEVTVRDEEMVLREYDREEWITITPLFPKKLEKENAENKL